MQRIIYALDGGGVAIVAPDTNSKLSLLEVATLSVPEGTPYKVVDSTEIPEDRSARNLWEVDETLTLRIGSAPKFESPEQAYAALVAWVDVFTAGFASVVPAAERWAFAAKEASARAYIAGGATETQTALLTDEAEITGETLNDLAAAVIAKADIEARISARVSGLRRAVKVSLEAATDPFQLEEILDAAKADAMAMADALGLPSPTTQPQPSEGA